MGRDTRERARPRVYDLHFCCKIESHVLPGGSNKNEEIRGALPMALVYPSTVHIGENIINGNRDDDIYRHGAAYALAGLLDHPTTNVSSLCALTHEIEAKEGLA